MTEALLMTPEHPVLAAVARMGEALKDVTDVNPVFMTTDQKAAALEALATLGCRLDELRLRVIADAGDVAAQTAARDIASWSSHHLHTRIEDARADRALASAIERRYVALGVAMRSGSVNRAQAQVIVKALDALPPEVDAELIGEAEGHLIDKCADFGPKTLARLGRRILEVVAPHVVDEAEARRLADLEATARRRTRLSLRAMGDGTTRISGLLPDAAAQRLGTYLAAFTSPRRGSEDPAPAPGPRLPYPRKLGEAFCSFLEAVDPQRLPIHGGDATTLVVTLTLADLRRELASADLLGSAGIPGDNEDQITAAQARRLACMANIVPAVLGADSEILDLGRSQRLFGRQQRRALMLRDRACRAEGCDVPAEWCEAHHLDAWSAGGSTDLARGILLCSHHHHRVHDIGYRTELLPNGDIRFHRRR